MKTTMILMNLDFTNRRRLDVADGEVHIHAMKSGPNAGTLTVSVTELSNGGRNKTLNTVEGVGHIWMVQDPEKLCTTCGVAGQAILNRTICCGCYDREVMCHPLSREVMPSDRYTVIERFTYPESTPFADIQAGMAKMWHPAGYGTTTTDGGVIAGIRTVTMTRARERAWIWVTATDADAAQL